MQTDTDTQYRPVDGDLTDRLEAFSTERKKIILTYRTWNDKNDSKIGHISNIFTRDHKDYLEMLDGTVIRLDKIIEIHETH